MHTVVPGWFGVSAVWFIPLVWRLVKSVLPGGAGLRGPGTIRLWLGFVGVLVASCALEATLIDIAGFNAFGHALSGGLGKLIGHVAAPLTMTALLIVSLPWLLDFHWRQFLAWADISLGLGLNIRAGRDTEESPRPERRSRRAAADDGLPAHSAPTVNPSMPHDGARRKRPTIWRPPSVGARKGRDVHDGREARQGLDGARAAGAMAAGLGASSAVAASPSSSRVEPGFRAPAEASPAWARSEPTASSDWLRGRRAPSPMPPGGMARTPVEPPRSPLQQAVPQADPHRQSARGAMGTVAGAAGIPAQPNAPWRSESGHSRPAMAAAMPAARAVAAATTVHGAPLAGAAGMAAAAARGFPPAGAPAPLDPLTSPFAQPATPRRNGPPPAAGSTAARAAAAAPPRATKPPRPFVWQGQPSRANVRPPMTAPHAEMAPATPAYSRHGGAGTTGSEAPLSMSVLETLRSIEENAARWTTLAGASLARRNLDDGATLTGPEALRFDTPEPGQPQPQFPTAAPHISTTIAVTEATPAPATEVASFAPSLPQETAFAPLANQDIDDVLANAGAPSSHEASAVTQPVSEAKDEALVARAAPTTPGATQRLAPPEALLTTPEPSAAPTPWQPARPRVEQPAFDRATAQIAPPDSPPPFAQDMATPSYDMPWILLDDEPSGFAPAEPQADEPFHTPLQTFAPQPASAQVLPAETAAAEHPAPGAWHDEPDALSLSNIVHFPRLVRETQLEADAAEQPTAVQPALADEQTPAVETRADAADTAATAAMSILDEAPSTEAAYGTYSGAFEPPAVVTPVHVANAAEHPAPVASSEHASPSVPEQTASEPQAPAFGATRETFHPSPFDQTQVVASAAVETAAAVAGPQPPTPTLNVTLVPAEPTSDVTARPVTPPWVAEPQQANHAPAEHAHTTAAAPVAPAAPYPAATAAPAAASASFEHAPESSEEPESPEPAEPPAQRAPVRGHAPTTFEFQPLTASAVELPGLDLLEPASSEIEPVSEQKLAETSQLIEQRLQEFKVPVTVVGASAGPVITRFEVEPALGVRGSQIVGLMKDLSRGLGLTSIRVVETIPGKTCMGLELPNARRQMIRLSEILESTPYHRSQSKLTIAMGKDIVGHPIVTDLAKAPHMLVAGTTGSGKSVAINAMILSLLYKATPEDVRLIMIDPKMLELSVYEGIPHLLAPVVTDMKLAANALNWCVGEMEKRYRLMSAVGVRNLAGFNQKIRDAEAQEKKIGNPFSLTPEAPEPLSPLPMIVVVIDELADLMMVAGKKIEELIARLAQKARAAGIHLILATQRPSVDVITGLIKANIPTRVAFQVSSKIDSRTILDQMGAESLLGQGDMLFLPPGTGYPQRVHGAFVADEEVHAVVEYLKQFGEPEYVEGILDGPASEGAAQDLFGDSPEAEADPLYDEAVAFVVRTRRASISSVQRQLRIGYNRAARLVEQMETAGLVSPMGINGSREVLVPGGQGE